MLLAWSCFIECSKISTSDRFPEQDIVMKINEIAVKRALKNLLIIRIFKYGVTNITY